MNDPARARVHAALALLDPVVARAESDARVGAEPLRRPVHQGAWSALRRIVIDPGHGGRDPGAIGPSGLSESAVTLDVSRRLAAHLAESHGFEVVMTRDRDEFVALPERTQRANRAAADLFLSIHCNSNENESRRGVSAYVLDTEGDAVASRVAARENAAGGAHDPFVGEILANLRLAGHRERSGHVARALAGALTQDLFRRHGELFEPDVRAARFHVLIGARMPAALVELSFLSNPLDASRLEKASEREALARALAEAIAALRRG